MKENIKSLLKKLNLYHPLQSGYRSSLSFIRNQYLRFVYAKYKTLPSPTNLPPPYQCNFCNSTYTRFVPEYPSPDIAPSINNNTVIAGYGSNVYCPNCLSKNRERLVKAVLQTRLSIDGKRILHFSPEKHLFQFINKTSQVTTVDISPGFYRNIDDSILYADATNLPFKNDSFDILIANHILEHIPEDIGAMKEMFRVLNAKGLAILQVPYSETLAATLEDRKINDPARQAALYGQKDHVRIYAISDYIQRLQQAGFNVTILTPQILMPFRIYAIQENESVFLCSKQPR
ncbi:MAG TPA: methyltransferase domain-containing protein [Puia sp.]|jgi:SAM-dependent methyltransferase|nr:methyltransferase domain-containing protein [Puia sp.]